MVANGTNAKICGQKSIGIFAYVVRKVKASDQRCADAAL
jgi:hypothetical protein